MSQEEFIAHGSYTISNALGYEVMISEDGEQARLRWWTISDDQCHTTEWLDIVDEFDEEEALECAINGDEDDPEEGDFYRRVIKNPYGHDVPLHEVMRIDRPAY